MTARGVTRSPVARILRAARTTLEDLRAAGRSLRTRPAPRLLAIGMLSLGIGLNGAVFTLVNAALFKGYPLVRDNHRIARLSTSGGAIFYPDFLEWRTLSRQFADIALTRGSFHTLAMPDREVETVFAAELTPNMFSLLGVAPFLGRGFTPADAEPGAAAVVVLGYDLWRARFDGDRGVVGTAIRLDGMPAAVVGVMRQEFSFPSTQTLWTPLIPTPAAMRRETPYAQYAYGRLASDATVDGARAELEIIGRRLEQAFPATNARLVPTVRLFEEWFIGADARRWVQALWWAVGCVLLIACVNVANLFILQAVGRSHEMSVRLALGAGRWRLVRVFVFESLLLSSLGGLVGLWVASQTMRLSQHLSTDFDVLALELDRPVVVYLSAISVAVGVIAGPATATPS